MSGLVANATIVSRATRDVVVGLRDELMELRLTGVRGRQCAMMALAVALATTVALEMRVDAPWWAAISAFVSVQATAPASVRRGSLRILGTAIGALLAFLVSPWLIDDHVALLLVLFAVSTLGVLGLQVSGHGYAWLLGAVTVDMVLLAGLGDPLSTLDVACNRTAEVVIGTMAAMVLATLLGENAEISLARPPPPGWSDLLGRQWPSVRHAVSAGLGVMLVPLVWMWLELPNLSQTAITVAAVMAVPALSSDEIANQEKITGRAMYRLLGCFLGGVTGLACLALSLESFLPWLLILTTGIWIAAHVQSSRRGIGYVGTQGAVVFITMLVQDWGPPTSILQGIDRFAGISGGLVILLLVSLLTAPLTPRRSGETRST
jgi:uncharacterized membrane protein YccC